MSEIEHEQETVLSWPDGSWVSVDRYRADPVAPWITGTYGAYCGACVGAWRQEFPDRTEALLGVLLHRQGHLEAELVELRRRLRGQRG